MEAMDEQAYRLQMLEYQKAIDWKLWEMLKIMQTMTDVDGATSDGPKVKVKVRAVIVEDGDDDE